MNQQLSEPLNKYLLKLVNKEAEMEYNYEKVPIPKVQRIKVKKGIFWRVFFRNVAQLKP